MKRGTELSKHFLCELGAGCALEGRRVAGLALTPEELVPFSHWTTPEGRPRRFSTWFFLAHVEPAFDVVVDGGEIRAHRWLPPASAIALRAQGELDLPPPTFVSLSALAGHTCASDALALSRTQQVPAFVPRLRKLAEGEVALYEGDAAYEGGELDVEGARHRLWALERRLSLRALSLWQATPTHQRCGAHRERFHRSATALADQAQRRARALARRSTHARARA